MSTKFQIKHRKSGGNLHIHPEGALDGSSAFQLVNLIHKKYNGKGRVFVNTENIKKIFPFGKSVFQGQLNFKTLPADKLFFKGNKGLEIAPNGSRVIIPRKHHQCKCNGDCRNCACKTRERESLERNNL